MESKKKCSKKVEVEATKRRASGRAIRGAGHLSSVAEGCAVAAERAALRVRVTSPGRIVFRVAAHRE